MVTPTLNAPVQHYEPFAGKYNEQMPRLLAAGYAPVSMAHAMGKRSEIQAMPSSEVRDALMAGWFGSWIDTADGIAHNGDNVKVVLGARPLITITSESPLQSGAFVITPEVYAQLDGQEFTRRDLEKAGVNNWLSLKKVRAHPVWQVLAGDQKLLDDYSGIVFDALQTKEAMGVYLSGDRGPSLRAWLLGRVDDGRRSNADDRGRLGGGDALLVGVRRGASDAEGGAS